MTAVAWDSWSTVPPSAPASLRREETPGCGGFLCRRRTPWPLPLDTLVFFVTCFSFCFSSLLPFFKVTFISVCQCLPHSTPTVLSSCRPTSTPSYHLGIPSGPACPGPRPGRSRGGKGAGALLPCVSSAVGKPRSLSDDLERPRSG